jgi:hypothetical protein
MRFDGVNDEVSFAATTDSPFSFTNGTDDTPFAITCWAKMTDATSFVVVSKQQSAREYVFRTDSVDKLRLNLSDGSNIPEAEVNTSLTEYENQWVHLCVAYSGAGPNSSRAFSDAASGIQFYINAKLVGSTATNKASYSGMNASSDQFRIGRQSSAAFANGEIRDVKIFNKELSAAEVKEVYSNGQLPESFAESTGAIAYAQDSTPSGEWAGVNATDADEAGPIGGKSNVLKMTINSSSSQHYLYIGSILTTGKRYRLNSKVYIPSTNSNMDGYQFQCGTSSPTVIAVDSSPTPDAWNAVSGEFVATAGSNPDRISIYGLDTGATSFTDAGGDDVLYVAETTITQIGSVLDARAENYNQSAGKLLDVSGNDFVGTQSGGVELLTPRSHLSAGTLDLTNLPTSATGLSAGEVYNDSGTLKIVS